MDEALDKKLVEAFPHLYSDYGGDKMVTCMAWGIETGDGWMDILWKASEKIEAEILKQPEDMQPLYRASQIKEKYGTLRFYMSGETKEMSAAIEEAEETSAITCEICGKSGSVMSRGGSPYGWLKCVCPDHSDGYGPNE